MNSLGLQKSIKDNSEELQDYMRGLKIWENDIKKEDAKLIEKLVAKKSNRKDTSTLKNKETIEPHQTMNESWEKKRKTGSRISAYDYEAWEKFDVEKALDSDSEEAVKPIVQVNKKQSTCNLLSETTLKNIDSHHIERAEKLKDEGNAFYAKGNLSDAIAKYTQGIGLNPSNPILPANRAMAYIKLKKFKAAEKDCNKSLQLDSTYIKAYLRRATIRVHLSKFSGAIEDYEKVLQLEPWNKDAKKELERLKKEHSLANTHSSTHTTEEDRTLDENKSKKLKVKEIDKETKVIPPDTKPLHLAPNKSVVDIPVVEVDSMEEIEVLMNKQKEEASVSLSPKGKLKTECVKQPPPDISKEVISRPLLPRSPKTSHQFSQDWRKVVRFEDLAHSYLQSIPTTFFHGAELEVDQLVEIVNTLCSDALEQEEVARIMAAVMQSQGFSLNIAFLEPKQKTVFEKIFAKLENAEAFKEQLKLLKDVL